MGLIDFHIYYNVLFSIFTYSYKCLLFFYVFFGGEGVLNYCTLKKSFVIQIKNIKITIQTTQKQRAQWVCANREFSVFTIFVF